MEKKYKLLTILFYVIYAVLLFAIGRIIIRDTPHHGMEAFIASYGVISVWIWYTAFCVTLFSPPYLHKIIKKSWKVPLIVSGIAGVLFVVWFFMMGIAVVVY